MAKHSGMVAAKYKSECSTCMFFFSRNLPMKGRTKHYISEGGNREGMAKRGETFICSCQCKNIVGQRCLGGSVG